MKELAGGIRVMLREEVNTHKYRYLVCGYITDFLIKKILDFFLQVPRAVLPSWGNNVPVISSAFTTTSLLAKSVPILFACTAPSLPPVKAHMSFFFFGEQT